MDIAIVKFSFSDNYRDNSTFIAFINVYKSDWSIFETCILSGESPISYYTLINRCRDIIIFQESTDVNYRIISLFSLW